MERAYILSRHDEITIEDFPITQELSTGSSHAGNGHGSLPEGLVRSVPDSFDLTALLERTEKQLIVKTLTATHGAQAEAARRMGLSRSALAYKLNKYGIRASE
jgi:DNA-binding NtrC family response regulator